MTEKKAPKLIYKYYRINENLFDVLISNQIYFSSIAQFNDPYDCHFTIKDSPTGEDFEKFWTQFGNDKETYQKFLELFEKNPKKCLEPILKALKGALNYYGICCFAVSKENFLMWSHYADSHKGVCLGFDYEMLTKQFTQFDKVEYRKEPFVYDLSDVSGSTAKAILTKSTHWEYEEEVRFLMERSKSCDFNIAALREVNFGAKTHPRHMLNVLYLVQKMGYANCSFHKARIIESNYSLDFEEVNFEELRKEVLVATKDIRYQMKIGIEEMQ
jgi:hypothetical protein